MIMTNKNREFAIQSLMTDIRENNRLPVTNNSDALQTILGEMYDKGYLVGKQELLYVTESIFVKEKVRYIPDSDIDNGA